MRSIAAGLLALSSLAAAGCGGGSASLSGASATFPTIALLTPTGQQPIAGMTAITAAVQDDHGIASVQFLLDGAPLGPPRTAPPWSFDWDSTSVGDGNHALSATVVDVDSLTSASAPRTVLVQNATVAPLLVAATYLGGSDIDSVRDVAVDAQGYVYVVGGTASPDFPATSSSYDNDFNGTNDAYVAKFTPDGSALVFATYLGGPGYDRAYAIEVGAAGDGYPTTTGAVQPSFGGDLNPSPKYGAQDGFVTKLSADGSTVIWSTFFGTDDSSVLRDLAIDAAGNVYVAGAPSKPHWAVTPGAFDTTFAGAGEGLVAEIAANGKSVVWGSYFGGSNDDGGTPSLRVAPDGSVWVLGSTHSNDFPVTAGCYQPNRGGQLDAVVLHVAAGGASLLGSTFFGGTGVEYSETHGVWVDDDGEVVISGSTSSANLPSVPATIPPPFQAIFGGSGGTGSGAGTDYAHDGYVARLSADCTTLRAFTYFGGSDGEGVEGVAVNLHDQVVFSGATYSDDLPLSGNGFQNVRAGGSDQFVVILSPDLSTLVYSTLCGGDDDDEGRSFALAADGSLVGAGSADSNDWPTLQGAFQEGFGGLPQDACWFKIVE